MPGRSLTTRKQSSRSRSETVTRHPEAGRLGLSAPVVRVVALLALALSCCFGSAQQPPKRPLQGANARAEGPLQYEPPGAAPSHVFRTVRAVVKGTFCWDLPPPPPRGALTGDPVGWWSSPFPLAATVVWGADGSMRWRVGGVAYSIPSGFGRMVELGGFTINATALTKDGPWWAYFARAINAQIDVDLAGYPPAYTSPFTEPRSFENYTAGSVYVRDPEHLDMSLVGRETIDGVDCELYLAKPRDPVKVEEPHVVHEYRIWVDAARGVQVRAEGLNAEGTPVRTLRCSDFVQRQDGSWTALTVTRRVLPGRSRGEHRWKAARVGHGENRRELDEVLAFDVEVEGHEQVTKYAVLANDLILPASVTRYNGNGDLIMQLRFENYEIDDLP